MRSAQKRDLQPALQKRYIRVVTLPGVKSAAKRYNEALGGWLELADAALPGAKVGARQSIAIDDVDAAAVMKILRAKRESFPPAAKAIGVQLDFPAAQKLGHQVAQILHALGGGPTAGPLPIAAISRDVGRVNIHVTRGRIKVSGFEAIDSFLNTIEGVEAWRIRRCELAECGRFFWATRRDSRCCRKQHAAVCRIRRYRARGEEYERRRELKRGREEYERRRELKRSRIVNLR